MARKQTIEQEKHTVERKISRTMFGDEHLSNIGILVFRVKQLNFARKF